MKNEDFRALLNGARKQEDGQSSSPQPVAASRACLGSGRPRSFAPMTARGAKGSKSSGLGHQTAKQKTGTKRKLISKPFDPPPTLAENEGKQKFNNDEDDERAKIINNLTESLKNDEIDAETYEKLRDQVTAGDLSATHLVVGLDRQLLERVRKGEDIYNGNREDKSENQQTVVADEELDLLAEKEVVAQLHEKREKQGERLLTKKDILARLKARRQNQEEKKVGQGLQFSGLGERREDGSYVRFEVDAKGREVMVVTLPDGTVKRKVRKAMKSQMRPTEPETIRQQAPQSPLISEKSAFAPTQTEKLEERQESPKPAAADDDDGDIFSGVEEYDPLAGLIDSDEEAGASARSPKREASADNPMSRRPDRPQRLFDEELSKQSVLSKLKAPVQDPEAFAKLAARANAIDPSRFRDDDEGDGEDNAKADPSERKQPRNDDDREARLKRKLAELQGRDRDAEDLDMGFGGSRFDDLEDMDMDEQRVRLSTWGDEDDAGRGDGSGAKKRKRGPKKKKGDKNNLADVMKVMEARKGG